jgi:hypothetical protein
MARVQDGAAQRPLARLTEQERLNGRFLRPVVTEGPTGLVLGDRHLYRAAVHPDGPAVQEVRTGRRQGL